MIEKRVTLRVPAEPAFARSVRMMAASLAVNCNMSVEDVEDVRMIAEEGFVYSCATGPEDVEVSFSLTRGSMSLDFSLGEEEPADESVDLAHALLLAVCDELVLDDAGTLRLVKVGASDDE